MYEKIKDRILLSAEIEFDNEEITENIKAKEEKRKVEENDEDENRIWQVEIPKIELIAPISEGTSQEVMLEFVGHFEHTSRTDGNIGLAAHNRGFPINYFSRLTELEQGDKIIYRYGNLEKTYLVDFITVIDDTNWSFLQETKENKITLITCIANKPNNRLCIQGIEIKEE